MLLSLDYESINVLIISTVSPESNMSPQMHPSKRISGFKLIAVSIRKFMLKKGN